MADLHRMTDNGLLIVANWPSDVGYAWWFMERIWITLANHHHDIAGGDVHIIYPKVGDIPRGIAEAPIQVHELDFSDHSRPNRKRLKAVIQGYGIRSVYLTDRATMHPLYAWLRFWGVRTIVNNDQTPGDRTTSWLRRAWKHIVHRTGVFSADLNVAPSQFVIDRFRDVYALPESRMLLIPNGIDPIDIRRADEQYVHREFGLPDDAIVVVSLSRAVRYKGIPFIIDCAHRLINEEGLEHLYFLHCGDGPDLMDFEARIRELGLTERFFLPGARLDYRDILPSCQVAIHASHGEGFSLAVLEMMSAALPLVLPDNSGNREAAEPGQSGCFYPLGSLDTATQHLRSLVQDPDLRNRIGEAARKRVLQRFTLEQTLQSYRTRVGPILGGRTEAPTFADPRTAQR